MNHSLINRALLYQLIHIRYTLHAMLWQPQMRGYSLLMNYKLNKLCKWYVPTSPVIAYNMALRLRETLEVMKGLSTSVQLSQFYIRQLLIN